MSSEEQKLEARIKHFKESEEISQSDKDFIDKFTGFLDRKGASSPHTKEKYLRWLQYILEHNENLKASTLDQLSKDELKQVNQEIVQQIQDSAYKTGDGDYAKKSKDDQWYAWKRVMESQGISTKSGKEYIPEGTSFTTDKSKADIQADTGPEDLPTPRQMTDFLKGLENVSHEKNKLRNICIPLLIWDLGTRYGETVEIQMKQVTVQGDRVKINVEGNKGSDNRTVEVFQGRKTLRDYIENHPGKNKPEAYLFPRLYHNDVYTSVSRRALTGSRPKFKQARDSMDLDFKLRGEPFHIFRKAMTTYYVVNDILSWEEVCTRQGKKADSTMPTYLKMAMQDIDSTAAEGFGLDTENREHEHRMKAPALLPRECKNCGKENRCYKDTCHSCGIELPEGDMPSSEMIEDEEEKVLDDAEIAAIIMKHQDKSFEEVQEIIQERKEL